MEGGNEWEEVKFGSPIRVKSSPVRSRRKHGQEMEKGNNRDAINYEPPTTTLSVDDFLSMPDDPESPNAASTSATTLDAKSARSISQLAFSQESTSTTTSNPSNFYDACHSFQPPPTQPQQTFISPELLSTAYTPAPTLLPAPTISLPFSNSSSSRPLFQSQSQSQPLIETSTVSFPPSLEFSPPETPTRIDFPNPDDEEMDVTPTRTRNSTITARTPRSSARRKPADVSSPAMSLGALQLGDEPPQSNGSMRKKLSRTASTPVLGEGSSRSTRQKQYSALHRATSPHRLRASPRRGGGSNELQVTSGRLSKQVGEGDIQSKKRKRNVVKDRWAQMPPLPMPPPNNTISSHQAPEITVSPPVSVANLQAKDTDHPFDPLQSPFLYNPSSEAEPLASTAMAHSSTLQEDKLFFSQTLPQFQPSDSFSSTGSGDVCPDLAEVFESLAIITQFLAENSEALNQNNIPFVTPEAQASLESLRQKAWYDLNAPHAVADPLPMS
ncbi:hypothetical protein BT69DRAFT_247247 [Atractiella rhizophila]|nr:hypothetical protein BT69DRAFT_247247 [Atractiella rhizophila]